MFHAMTPAQAQITDLKLVLWMPTHNHGSSPVDVNQVGVNKYHVTNAFFVMPGEWIVRATFEVAGKSHKLEIPVLIAN